MNMLSILFMQQGKSPLTATDPVTGIGLFAVYTPVLLLGMRDWRKVYLLGTVALVVIVFLGGILKHVGAFFEPTGLEGYASLFWWFIAIALNGYGVIASVFGMFHASRSTPTRSLST